MTKKDSAGAGEGSDYEALTGETCPVCHAKTLTLTEARRDVPFFGMCYLFSMDCSSCGYHKADIEAEEEHPPAKYEFTVQSEDDLKVRVIKSSNATVKLGALGTIEPGEAANGYITNIEGILNRFKHQVEHLKRAAEEEEDDETAAKCKTHLKKLIRIMWGQEPLKITINDPTGNSAIISPKTVKK